MEWQREYLQADQTIQNTHTTSNWILTRTVAYTDALHGCNVCKYMF